MHYSPPFILGHSQNYQDISIDRNELVRSQRSVKGDDSLTITANNEVEFQHWCYALGMAVARLRKDASKSIIPPPHYPVHSGYLLFWDSSMKWKKKYVVLTEDSLFINEHRRIGFGTPPLRYSLVGSQSLLLRLSCVCPLFIN